MNIPETSPIAEAIGLAIYTYVPTADIAARLDGFPHDLSLIEPFAAASGRGRADVLELLFDLASKRGPEHVRDGVRVALRGRSIFPFDQACDAIVLNHATADDLNHPTSSIQRPDGVMAVPQWWHFFRTCGDTLTDDPRDLHAVLVLLRERGADLAATPFSGESDEGGGTHGDALRSLLRDERIERERTVLREAAAEAMAGSESVPATQTRKRL
ncbi:hypothetical protein LGM69_25440 [Burkholderia multivorans]|nr:hypothetical protein [Burkholderia multivorans]